MNDIQTRWHMIEDDKVKHALEHILGDKRRLQTEPHEEQKKEQIQEKRRKREEI